MGVTVALTACQAGVPWQLKRDRDIGVHYTPPKPCGAKVMRWVHQGPDSTRGWTKIYICVPGHNTGRP